MIGLCCLKLQFWAVNQGICQNYVVQDFDTELKIEAYNEIISFLTLTMNCISRRQTRLRSVEYQLFDTSPDVYGNFRESVGKN